MTASNLENGGTITKRRSRASVLARWLGSILVVAATLGVIAFLAWKKYSEIQMAMNMPAPPEMPMVVGIQPAGIMSWRQSTTCIGTILAPRFITVNNESPGTVSAVNFKPGQLVNEDDKLLTLDTSVEEAQLKAAQVREKFALATLERNREVENSVSQKELQDVESLWEQARAEVEELQAMIARKTIVSPFRGRVGLSDVQRGQYLPIGTEITTLHSVEGHLLVEFTLAQFVVNQVDTGDSVTVVYGTTKKEFPATISAIDAQSDRQTRNMRVRARVDHPPESLRPGDSVSVKVEYGPPKKLASVPAEAVRHSPQGTFVFLAEKNQAGELRATAATVVLATATGSNIGIASGLTVDDPVIVEGSFKLQEGALITPAPPEGNPEGETTSGQ